MKKEESHTHNELKRYLGVPHEEHLHALKAISEQFVDVHRKLDEHSSQLVSHTEMMGEIAEDLSAVKSDVEVIKSDIGIIKNDLKQKVDRGEFALLERRVTRLESKVR